MKYITYWIPLTNTIDLDKQFYENKDKSLKKDIKDNPSGKVNELKVTILSNRNLLINYLSSEYTLEHKHSKEMGIITYEHNIQEPNVKRILYIHVYSLFKSFFHIHEAHDGEEDAIINAYNHAKYEKHNFAIDYYCRQYIYKFNEYLGYLAEDTPEIIWNSYAMKKSKYMIRHGIKSILENQNIINKAQTEIIYFKFLFKYSNNKTYFKREYSYFYEKFNVLYKEYEMLDEKFDIEYNEKINKHQFILSILGSIVGVIGIWLTLLGLTTKVFYKRIDVLDENIKKECTNYFYKKNSMDNFMLSLEHKNFNSLEYLKNNCNSK